MQFSDLLSKESTNSFSKQWVYYNHSLICLPQGIQDQNKDILKAKWYILRLLFFAYL